MQNPFYLTLPSNASMGLYPSNKTCSFTTKLPQAIELVGEGDWEIALVEVLYPMSFFNILKDECHVQLEMRENAKSNTAEGAKTPTVKAYTFEIPAGYYRTLESLLSRIDSGKAWFKSGSKFKFSLDSISDYISITIESGGTLTLSNPLKLILGFDDKSGPFSCPLGVSARSFRGNNPANLNKFLLDQMYVYSDIVRNEFIGDTMAPLLRIVAVDDKPHGTIASKTFNSPHYVKVGKRFFDLIDIDIRNSLGKAAPFEFGTLTSKLHFRPCPRVVP